MKKFGLTLLLLLTSSIYPETINGYVLPAKPDSKINNSTLLGIDSNNNGVRDDVERWIYNDMPTYHYPKIERVIAMQQAKAYQVCLSDPNNTNDIPITLIHKGIDCWDYYIELRDIPFNEAYKAMSRYLAKLQDKVYNTKDRLETYRLFNQNLGVRTFTDTLNTVTNCETNIDLIQ